MDKDFYHLNVSISKALSPSEAPLKMKHARSVIIATHRTKGVKHFWAIITRQPIMEHRFTAWKFCHMLHKILREGHDNAIKQSQTHKTLLLEVGKLWGHLQDGVGKCIQVYTVLLVNKLDFHQKNACFPGSLAVDFNEVKKMAGDDYNIYFQLCVEVFDYLDHIIEVQSEIFSSINTYRMSSMTPQGQCRLAPLITLIQDSNPLYDICVRIMFRLHDGLPHDVLGGHRNRFNEIFSKLKLFYENVRPLQYFSDVIQLPHLPENAPNFSSEVDLGNYTAPVMVLQQEPEPEPSIESLVDLTNATENFTASELQQENILHEKDVVIGQLQYELSEKQIELERKQFELERYSGLANEITNFRRKNEAIERELAMTREILQNTTLVKDNLELKLNEMSFLEGEVKEGDEKCKQMEDKFEKIKTMYTKLREEHISLLRMRNEDSKQVANEKKANEELKIEIEDLKERLEQSIKTDELNASLKSKTLEYENSINDKDMCIETLTSDLNNSKILIQKINEEQITLREQYENQVSKQQLEIEEIKSKTLEYENSSANKDLSIEQLTTDLNNSKILIEKINEEQISLKEQYENQVKKLNEDMEEIKQSMEKEVKAKQNEIDSLLALKLDNESIIEKLKQEKNKIFDERTNIEQELKKNNDELNTSLKTKTQKYEHSISQQDICIEKLTADLNNSQQLIEKIKEEQISLIDQHENQLRNHKLESEEIKQNLEKEIQTSLKQINDLLLKKSENEAAIEKLELKVNNIYEEKTNIEHELKQANEQIIDLKKLEIESNIASDSIITSVIKSLLYCLNKDFSLTNLETKHVPEYAEQSVETIKTQFQRINEEYKTCKDNNKKLKDVFVSSGIELISALRTLHEYINIIFNNTKDMEKAEDLRNMYYKIHESLLMFYKMLLENDNTDPKAKEVQSNEIVNKLIEFKNMLSLLRNSFTEDLNIGDMLQQELKDMEMIIEEATKRMMEMQLNSKSNNEGIKLEVNDKILDSCTNLMKSIILLIRKSRDLQEEIITHGKGTFTEKEFYKRNSQWTEGLISASKSVAKGANFLVDAANKAIVMESSECFEIIVAAQEIAASTAQLVIASKVKAGKDSKKLMDLTKASRDVSLATGLVVANVKDGNSKTEYLKDIDMTKLTTSQKKAMEMEMHIKVLQLEQALDNERQNLMSFRKKFYQSSDDD